MIGPLDVPISKSFGLSGFESGLIPLSFFIAYLISIPAAILNERIKEKKAMTIAFLFAGSGASSMCTSDKMSFSRTPKNVEPCWTHAN